ncbi:Thiamin-phosphate pyrophosphorylase [hydrothermal vent metagenome]|uniref:thiamine phosphate synthase n=1 Tax=hydrothermal vent metagenome TaxID=652676 RepID=A0A3B1B2Y1_9ZZZZ
MSRPLRGLYVITDRRLMGDDLLSKAEQAIAGGARLLQYRDKSSDSTRREREAIALAQRCKQHGVCFIINDDPALALKTDADGVHLGQNDGDITTIRQSLGRDKIIGVTCHSSLKKALAAEQAGADYVAFGRFFPSQTKPDAPSAEIDILLQGKRQLSIPVVAIGGITHKNGAELIAAGADMLAVIHDIFGATDIRRAATALARLFD